MVITIVAEVEKVVETAKVEKVVKENIEYWGFYSGTAKIGEMEIEFRRNKANKDDVEIVVEESIPWL